MKALMVITLLFFVILDCHAVVKRHDIAASNYVVDKAPEYLIDMPHEGHGVLIADQWIVTVAHTIFYDYEGKEIKIGAAHYEIKSVHIHPEYVKPSESMLEGDATRLMSLLKERSDIALIKLTAPVVGVEPIKIYSENNEVGQIITVFGRGATGDGISGEVSSTKQARQLNRFQNIIEEADSGWLAFKFDLPEDGLSLEGMHGSGDSGGASIVFNSGTPLLVGLTSWQYWNGDIGAFKGGLYGTVGYQVRLSDYRAWILATIETNVYSNS